MKPVSAHQPSKECITFALLRMHLGDDEDEIVEKCQKQYGVTTTWDEVDSWNTEHPDCAERAEIITSVILMFTRNNDAEDIIAQIKQCSGYHLTTQELQLWKDEFAEDIHLWAMGQHQRKLDGARCTWLNLPERVQVRIKTLLLHPDVPSLDVATVLHGGIKSLNLDWDTEQRVSQLTAETIEHFDELFRGEWEQKKAEQERRHVLKNQIIELRSKGKTLKQIVKELQMSVEDFVTIIEENKAETYQSAQVQKAIRLEDLQQRYWISAEKRSEMLGKHLKKAIEALNKRNLDDVPTEKLMDFIVKTSVVLAKEEQAMKPFGEIVQSW
jgi:hypothetical protein